MSQTYYSENYPQQYYPPTPYNATQPPIQHIQHHTPNYNYQNSYCGTGVTPSAQTVNDSSVLAQTYTYPGSGYAADTTTNAPSSYGSTPNHMVSHHPDSVNQIPHQGVPQYGSFAPGQSWPGPVQYAEVPAIHPSDFHDQRRGSCASMSTDGSGWHSHDGSGDGHYDRTQSMNHYANHYDNNFQQQQQQLETMSFGMYSPTQYARTQELARNAPHEPSSLDAPYGSLPIHEPIIPFARSLSDGYQIFDKGSIVHSHASPSTQPHYPSTEAPSPLDTSVKEESDSTEPEDEHQRDLFAQQRRAASYQQELQAQQELKYQLSGRLDQFEASHRRHDGFTPDHDHQYHQHHLTHHRQSSSSSDHHSHRLAPAPVVPSQAHERAPAYASSSPEAEEKKDAPAKKPALACLFCRKRKIACGPPPPDSLDRTCNQCLRRKQVCEYPTESRRGIRKTPKEPAPEEPTVHKFVHGDASLHDGTGAIRRGRRKRTGD